MSDENVDDDEKNNTQSIDNGKPLVNDKDSYVPPLDDWSYPLLKDVIGNKKLISTLEHIVMNIENPDLFRMAGVSPQKIYLFNGGPGLGKTFAAKAIRNTAYLNDDKVMWTPYNIGEHGTAYINMGARIVNSYFKHMKKLVRKGYKVIGFMDEADDLLRQRNSGAQSHAEDQKVTNEFMKQMNDINQYDVDITFILATNFEKALDTAAVRSGRIDLIVPFEKPTTHYLMKAYRLYTNKVNENAAYDIFKRFPVKKAALLSKGYNYADVQAVVEMAARDIVYKILEMGDDEDIIKPPRVTLEGLIKAINNHNKSRDFLTHKKNKIGFT